MGPYSETLTNLNRSKWVEQTDRLVVYSELQWKLEMLFGETWIYLKVKWWDTITLVVNNVAVIKLECYYY